MSSSLSRLLLVAGVTFSTFAVPAVAADVLNRTVGQDLQAAQNALGAHNYKGAMAQVDKAAAVSGRSDYDDYTIAQMRAAIAAQSGDASAAIKAYDVLIASPRTPKATKGQMLMAEATMAYGAKDYATAVAASQRYLKEIGPNPAVETTLIQSYYLQNDFKNAAAAQKKVIDADLKAKKTPPENQLQLLATCQKQLNDEAGLTHTYVLLATYYPKPEYWAQLLHGLVTNDKLPPALQLDVYRIRLAAGNLTKSDECMDMTEMAMQAGLPQVALNLMNSCYAAGILGKDTGAAREARLKAMIVKAVADKKASIDAEAAAAPKAPNGNALITAGYNYVSFGDVDKGVALIDEGLKKGPFDMNVSKLRKAMALKDAGRTKDAIAVFETVEGDNGASDIAQLWILKLKSGQQTAQKAG